MLDGGGKQSPPDLIKVDDTSVAHGNGSEAKTNEEVYVHEDCDVNVDEMAVNGGQDDGRDDGEELGEVEEDDDSGHHNVDSLESSITSPASSK